MGENKENQNGIIEENKNRLCKIMYTLKTAFVLEHFVGIYRFYYKDSQLLPSNRFHKAYALFLIVAYITLYGVFLDLTTLVDGQLSLVEMMDQIPCLIILIQYVIALLTANILLNKDNIEMFHQLADLDVRLITASSDEFYKKARVKTNKLIASLAISHILISIVDLVTAEFIDTTVIVFLPLFLIQKLEIIIFCLVIDTLKTRLDVINGYISKFLDEVDGTTSSVYTVYDDKEEVKEKLNMIGHPSENNMKIWEMAIMYDNIGSICSKINSVFNFQVFMTLLSTFTFIIITIWTSLYVYRTPENNSGPLITIVIWCFATLMTVVIMCFVCEWLNMSRNTTKILVNQIVMDYNLPKTMRIQAKAFMELIDAWPLRILIYDMFSVDITLLLKFISVSTTYLIVIIQISHLT